MAVRPLTFTEHDAMIIREPLTRLSLLPPCGQDRATHFLPPVSLHPNSNSYWPPMNTDRTLSFTWSEFQNEPNAIPGKPEITSLFQLCYLQNKPLTSIRPSNHFSHELFLKQKITLPAGKLLIGKSARYPNSLGSEFALSLSSGDRSKSMKDPKRS